MDLKSKLIALGQNQPELREHLRPVLAKLVTAAKASARFNLGGTKSGITVEDLKDLEKGLDKIGVSIESTDLFVSPRTSYIDVYVTWDVKITREALKAKESEVKAAVKATKWGKNLTSMGVNANPSGGSFTLDLK